jgi:hypothetical protein
MNYAKVHSDSRRRSSEEPGSLGKGLGLFSLFSKNFPILPAEEPLPHDASIT